VHPDLAQILLVTALAIVSLAILAALVRSRAQEHLFAGPHRDQWQKARRQLGHLDQWRVTWATHRNHPVSGARLAGAQLVYVRYLQDAARPTLLGYRWLRTALPAIYGVLAAGYATFAVTQSQGRIVHSLIAACWAAISLIWALAVPRSVRRMPEKLVRLQAEIERAHGMPTGDSEMP
jgi:hypothetical protein